MRTTPVVSLVCLVAAALPASGQSSVRSTRHDADAGPLILQDGFSDPAGGWERSHDPSWVKDYLGGEYQIANLETMQITYASRATPELRDVDLAVTARKVSGGDDIRIGLTARTSDSAFVEAAMRPAGQCSFRVVHRETGARRSRVAFVPCLSARPGSQPNRLRLVVVGTHAEFFLNDARVATLDDVDVVSGTVGVFASSTDTPSDVRFDDLELRKPARR